MRYILLVVVFILIGCASLPILPSKEVGSASLAARDYFSSKYPKHSLEGVTLKANEETRYVFVVFFKDIEAKSTPSSYGIVTVRKSDGFCEEMVLSPESPYWLKGRK